MVVAVLRQSDERYSRVATSGGFLESGGRLEGCCSLDSRESIDWDLDDEVAPKVCHLNSQ